LHECRRLRVTCADTSGRFKLSDAINCSRLSKWELFAIERRSRGRKGRGGDERSVKAKTGKASCWMVSFRADCHYAMGGTSLGTICGTVFRGCTDVAST